MSNRTNERSISLSWLAELRSDPAVARRHFINSAVVNLTHPDLRASNAPPHRAMAKRSNYAE
jgi:hypothetical protein